MKLGPSDRLYRPGKFEYDGLHSVNRVSFTVYFSYEIQGPGWARFEVAKMTLALLLCVSMFLYCKEIIQAEIRIPALVANEKELVYENQGYSG